MKVLNLQCRHGHAFEGWFTSEDDYRSQQERGLLAKLPASVLSQIPAQDSAPDGEWVGVAARVSALAYNTSEITASQMPAALIDLEQPQWKGKLAIAPSDSDFVPLVSEMIAHYGVDTTKKVGKPITPVF